MTPPTFMLHTSSPRLPSACFLFFSALAFSNYFHIFSTHFYEDFSTSVPKAVLSSCVTRHTSQLVLFNTSRNQSSRSSHKIHLTPDVALSANASSSSAQLSAPGITFVAYRPVTQFSFSIALSHLSFSCSFPCSLSDIFKASMLDLLKEIIIITWKLSSGGKTAGDFCYVSVPFLIVHNFFPTVN